MLFMHVAKHVYIASVLIFLICYQTFKSLQLIFSLSTTYLLSDLSFPVFLYTKNLVFYIVWHYYKFTPSISIFSAKILDSYPNISERTQQLYLGPVTCLFSVFKSL